MELYDIAISLRPDNYYYYLRKGNVLRMSGRNDEAIALFTDAWPVFDEAISRAQHRKELLIGKSRLLKAAGRLRESVECLEIVIALDPEDNSHLIGLADAYLLLLDYGKVVELSDVVINRSASYSYAHGNKGEALEAMGRLDDAMECYIKSIEMNNDYLLEHMGKGSVFSKQVKDKEALVCWNEVFRINQINPDQGYNINKDERERQEKVLSSRIELLHNFAELNEQVAAAKNATVSIDNNKLTDIFNEC